MGARWGAGTHAVFRARLCVAELAANVLEHGIANGDAGPDHITVTLGRCDEAIKIEFVDTRGRFDPTWQVAAAPAASLESADPRGRGLGLLQAYARHLSYSRNGTRNRLTFSVVSEPMRDAPDRARLERPWPRALAGQDESALVRDAEVTGERPACSCPSPRCRRSRSPRESGNWNALHAHFEMKRINHQEAYSLDGAAPIGPKSSSPGCGVPRSATITTSPARTSWASPRKPHGVRITAASRMASR